MLYIFGEYISIATLAIGSGLGVAAGGLVCLLLRKSWGIDAALIDALIAPAVAVAFTCAVLTLDRYAALPYSPAGLLVPVAVGSVVVRHLARAMV